MKRAVGQVLWPLGAQSSQSAMTEKEENLRTEDIFPRSFLLPWSPVNTFVTTPTRELPGSQRARKPAEGTNVSSHPGQGWSAGKNQRYPT